MRPTNNSREPSDSPPALPSAAISPKALDARSGPGAALASFDLNLLVAFEALWVERSVTAAGRRLGLSQPATSAALARLRLMLGDRLFVRGKNGLEPTARCAELAAPLSKTLIELRNTLAGSSFDPATTTREIRIGAVDAAIAVWMPRLLARTMQEAPKARVRVLAIDPTRATRALEDGSLDLALSPILSPSSSVRGRALYKVDLVVAVRPAHPLARKRKGASLEGFPRVHVMFEGMTMPQAPVIVSSFLAVPPILTHSDAWALLPRPYAAALDRDGVLAMLPLPDGFKSFNMTMQMLWPEAQDAAPASKWIRGLLVELTSKPA
jgi:DNA-binding transcriptional LysR family regulator